MKIDNTIAETILETSKELNIDKDKILFMLSKYYKGIKNIMETEPPSCIKIDFFGKLIYNNALRARLDKVKELNTPIKIEIEYDGII